jgi:leucyl-tRNA---protein transferase
MSRDISPDLRYLRLYFTRPHRCSYLPEREAVTSFVDPTLNVSQKLYSHLSRLGFRRSGKFYYAPSCGNCQACVACRIVVDDFRMSRSFRRCLKKSEDLSRTLVSQVSFEEHYPLFNRYIQARHFDGDMYPASREQYEDFLGDGEDITHYLEFRRNGKLVGCSVADVLDDGLSAIYTYFDPEEKSRSPGTLAILTMVELAREMGLAYVYLGYWIDGCRKMSYKDKFQPLEFYSGHRWLSGENQN